MLKYNSIINSINFDTCCSVQSTPNFDAGLRKVIFTCEICAVFVRPLLSISGISKNHRPVRNHDFKIWNDVLRDKIGGFKDERGLGGLFYNLKNEMPFFFRTHRLHLPGSVSDATLFLASVDRNGSQLCFYGKWKKNKIKQLTKPHANHAICNCKICKNAKIGVWNFWNVWMARLETCWSRDGECNECTSRFQCCCFHVKGLETAGGIHDENTFNLKTNKIINWTKNTNNPTL